jgi:transposase InsO family protein
LALEWFKPLPHAVTWLNDPSPSGDATRDLAIRCVQERGLREHIPAVRKYVRDPNDVTRIAAIVALSDWGDEESRPAFEEASKSSTVRLQRAGKAALQRLDARNLRMHFDELPVKPAYFIHDRDIKFTKQFDTILSNDKELEVIKLPARSPNLNAFAERWVRSFREECLDHFIVFGEGHMRHIAEEYIAHYNAERPHQGKGNNTLVLNARESPANGPVTCKTRLGGLLKHYVRQAA